MDHTQKQEKCVEVRHIAANNKTFLRTSSFGSANIVVSYIKIKSQGNDDEKIALICHDKPVIALADDDNIYISRTFISGESSASSSASSSVNQSNQEMLLM